MLFLDCLGDFSRNFSAVFVTCFALGAKVTMGHMVNVRRALVAVLLLALLAFAWMWLTRPQRVDMTGYAPADSIVYAEADSLPSIIDAFTSTDAWRELAPAAGVEAR